MHTTTARLVPLEAYRGLAALIVLLHHFFLAFSPRLVGSLPELRDDSSLVGTPWFLLLNGTGAVTFFFTLSGFVLSWSYFQRLDTATLRRAFLRRWPRLAGIVMLSAVLSAAMYQAGLYYFAEAATVSGSPWLARQFMYMKGPPDMLLAAIEGATTFVTGQFGYNSNFWTMRTEFFGSMLVYMLSAFLVLVLNGRHLLPALLLLSVSAAYAWFPMLSFIFGTFLAFAIARSKPVLAPLPCAAILLVSLYLLAYLEPLRYYAWMAAVPRALQDQAEILVQTIGSLGLIYATMGNQRLFKRLDNGFFAALGRFSFPIYLSHILVISSVSSYCYLKLQDFSLSAAAVLAITLLCTLLGTLALSWPLEKFDAWWVGCVNRRIGGRHAPVSQGQERC